MNAVALALALVMSPQDTTVPRADSLHPDPTAPSYAPTLRNTALLSGILAQDQSAYSTVAPQTDRADTAYPVTAADDSTRRRPKAVEYSDLYYTRLKIHQIASYLTVPLFVAQYLAGRELWNHPDSHGLAKDAMSAALPCATVASFSPLDGSSVSKYSPASGASHCPSIK